LRHDRLERSDAGTFDDGGAFQYNNGGGSMKRVE